MEFTTETGKKYEEVKRIYYTQEKTGRNDKIISEIKTKFQDSQGKNSFEWNLIKGIKEILGNNQENENKRKM